MRSRVESRCFEVDASRFQQTNRRGGGALCRSDVTPQQPIDVVYPESDAFHVKCGNRTRQAFALGNDWSRPAVTTRLEHPNQIGDTVLRGLTIVDGHGI